jgi:hypothetical protein
MVFLSSDEDSFGGLEIQEVKLELSSADLTEEFELLVCQEEEQFLEHNSSLFGQLVQLEQEGALF